MKKYSSEIEIINIIDGILSNIIIDGKTVKAKTSFDNDIQEPNSIERRSVFKVAIALENSEKILSELFDIGDKYDRGIAYVGSKTTPTDAGEVRYLLFQAYINPKIGDYCG